MAHRRVAQMAHLPAMLQPTAVRVGRPLRLRKVPDLNVGRAPEWAARVVAAKPDLAQEAGCEAQETVTSPRSLIARLRSPSPSSSLAMPSLSPVFPREAIAVV